LKRVRSPFIGKLWMMLMDPEYQNTISWDLPMRQSFTVHSANKMEKQVLPRFFKSHKFKSLQR
jgi:hypothetical protein